MKFLVEVGRLDCKNNMHEEKKTPDDPPRSLSPWTFVFHPLTIGWGQVHFCQVGVAGGDGGGHEETGRLLVSTPRSFQSMFVFSVFL